MHNMELWNKVATPPTTALRRINAGRLKGMSDIKPQWRVEIMTDVYGPCGVGWKFEVTKKWTEPVSDNQIFAFADIDLYIKVDDKWSDPIPGNGGSKLITKEKAGLHSSDEAYKMAITDALGTAMKMIGVASEVYMGNWDGSKYINQKPEPVDPITEKQLNEITDMISETSSDESKVLRYFGAKSLKEETKILGISVSDDTELVKKEVLTIAQDTVQSLDLGIGIEKDDLIVLDEYIQEGYGVLNKDVAEAVRLMSEKEGVFLDPVYTGKAMVALIDLTKKGYFKKGDNVLFVHTGGTPALFPNKHKLLDFLKT